MREPKSLRDVCPPTDVRAHVGVIDVGSNALRLQIARVFEDGTFCVIFDEREPIRLGQEVFRTGKLSPKAMKLALNTLSRFSTIAREHQVKCIRSVATSAVREAKNSSQFTKEVKTHTGLELEIISGSKEAKLIARGVLSNFRYANCRLALVDIGGGSTEISLVESGELEFSGSIPVGSARFTEQFCLSDPLLPGHERVLREHVREQLYLRFGAPPIKPYLQVVGSAGTIGALANFIRHRPSAPRSASTSRMHFSVVELHQACLALSKMPLLRRRKAPGIEERRAEIIVAGAIILEEICTYLQALSVKVMRRGLRDGLMLEEIGKLIPDQPPATTRRRPYRPIRNKS